MEKHSSKKGWIWLAVIAAAVAIIAVKSHIKPESGEPSTKVVEEVLSAEIHTGDISSEIITTSTVKDIKSDTVTLPGKVKVKEWRVSEGDYVSELQEIAAIDLNSLKSAMAYVNDEIAQIDMSLKKCSTEVTEKTVKAPVGGRVKEIYASEGDLASDVMYEYGALAAISLDGKMAVRIENSELWQGDKVSLILSNGDELLGTVSEVYDGAAVITVSDEKADNGDEVTVLKDGNEIGSGAMYIHSELKVSEYSGNIKTVYIKKNDKVNSGSAMFRTAITETNAEYQMLLAERRELEEHMQELFKAYETGVVRAKKNGRISKIYDDESDDLSEEETKLYTISDYSELEFEVSVDELDVLNLKNGDTANVTLDALQNRVFEATVTDIDLDGKNVGGHTKYTVTLKMERTKDMLTGMNLSVRIPIKEYAGILIIPMEALNEDAEGTFVYTSYNKEENVLADPVYITTGVSDGSFAEVTSGISEGTKVWYKFADRIEYVSDIKNQ